MIHTLWKKASSQGLTLGLTALDLSCENPNSKTDFNLMFTLASPERQLQIFSFSYFVKCCPKESFIEVSKEFLREVTYSILTSVLFKYA